ASSPRRIRKRRPTATPARRRRLSGASPKPGSEPAPPRAYAVYALGLLTLINLLNYTDRNVVFALFQPLKRELALTDHEPGWLGAASRLRHRGLLGGYGLRGRARHLARRRAGRALRLARRVRRDGRPGARARAARLAPARAPAAGAGVHSGHARTLVRPRGPQCGV